MSLNASLNIGRTGLLSSQSALQTVGNNLANAATPGYHRQRVDLAPLAGQRGADGAFLGRGVQIESITRMIDQALEGRLRNAGSDLAGS
ncbi:MAG: flagellar basal body protein, partial [Phycisphaeraceae bacterium]